MGLGFKVINDNYLSSDVYTSIAVSSTQTGFPVTNMEAGTFRESAWKSDGFWNVTASNKTIIFQETDTVDLTATLAEGEITSRDAMSTAIKTALEAAGANTYTVTRVDEKFVIATSGAFLRIKGDDVSMTASDLLGFTTNQSDASSVTADLVRIHEYEKIEIDFGVAKRPNAVIFTGARGETLKMSPTATVKFQMNTTNVWTSPLVDETLTVGDDFVYKIEDDYFNVNYCRYARIYIEDKDNGNGYLQINLGCIGTDWALVRGRANFPFEETTFDKSDIVINRNGTYFADERAKTYDYKVDINGLNVADKEDIQDFYNTYGKIKPFFVSMDNNNAFTSTPERLLKVVRLSDNLTAKLTSPKFFTCNFRLSEVL